MHNKTDETLHFIICMLFPMLLSTFVIQLIAFPLTATAGVIGDIADLGLKVALIRHWKALLGVMLLLGGAYAIAHKPTFKYKLMAISAAITLYMITIWGGALLLGEFWSDIEPVISSTALFVRRLF